VQAHLFLLFTYATAQVARKRLVQAGKDPQGKPLLSLAKARLH
jgi:hypothetical protein